MWISNFFSNFYLNWFFSNLSFFERDPHMDSPEAIWVKNTDPLMVMVQNLNLWHNYLISFWFLVPFFACLASRFEKVLIWHKKNLFQRKSKKSIKNIEFHADFKSDEKAFKKCTQKKLWAKQVWLTWVKKEKVHISIMFLLITFFYIFKNFFNGFEISIKFCVFYTNIGCSF